MDGKPVVEERVWAVLAHLSALAMGMGLLLPVIGWSENRRKSNYTAFQSLQALGYQTLGYTIWILSVLVVVVIVSVGALAGILSAENLEQAALAFVVSHVTLMLGLMAVYFLLPVWGAVSCAFGSDFRYPFMGNRLARYLSYEPNEDEGNWLVEEHEDRWVASMGHFSVIIMLWGMLTPLTAWVTRGGRSPFLKFQSVQALVFQAGTMLLYILSGLIYFGGAIFFFISIGGLNSPSLDSPLALSGMVVFFASMLCMLVIVLTVPLLHIMGQWAGYRVLKGDEYRYPLVGRLAERWMKRDGKPDVEEELT
jgi:uncharacterized Tic20 family protein